MSDTPRCDHWTNHHGGACTTTVPADFARILEREIAALQSENETLVKNYAQLERHHNEHHDTETTLQSELTEARKDAERYRWIKECTNEQFAYLEKEWCGLDNAIDCLMAVERNA